MKRITLHGFRHSHASNLIIGGMDIISVSRRLGHENIDMTLKVYSHLLPESDRNIITFLEKSSQNLLKQ